MPLTQEQFQKAKAAGFTTDQIIGFEKQRESSTPDSMPHQEKDSMATQGLDYIKEHPVKSVMQGLPETVTGKTMEQRAIEDVQSPDFGDRITPPRPGGLTPTQGERIRSAAENRIVMGYAEDMVSSPINYLAAPILKATGTVVGKGAQTVSKGFSDLVAPFNESKAIQGQINNLKNEVGLPKEATTGYINKTLTNQEKDILAQKKQQIDSVKNYVNTKIDDIKLDKSEFDKNILNSKATDFAKYMKDSGVNWARKGSQKYGDSIDKISSLIPEDAPITASDSSNFFKDIASNAESQGINSPMLGYIKNLSKKYEDIAIQQFDAGVEGIPVNFGTLKNEINGVNKYLSPGFKNGKYINGDDRLASMSKGKWLDFMGKYMPEEGISEYKKLQSNYSQFADAKKNIGNMFHPYSGEFDLTAGINSAKKIALDKVNEGTENLMNVLEKGIPDFVPGIPGFSEKTQGLVKAGQEKKILDIFPGLIQKSGKLATSKIEDQVGEQMKQVTAWRKKYDELVELQKRNQEAKDKIMNVLSMGIRPVVKAAKKSIGF